MEKYILPCTEYILLFRLILYVLYLFTGSFSTFYIGLFFTRTVAGVNVYLMAARMKDVVTKTDVTHLVQTTLRYSTVHDVCALMWWKWNGKFLLNFRSIKVAKCYGFAFLSLKGLAASLETTLRCFQLYFIIEDIQVHRYKLFERLFNIIPVDFVIIVVVCADL